MESTQKPLSERVAFDFSAKTEFVHARRWMERLIGKLLDALAKPSPHILETACVGGWDTEIFLRSGARVVSICPSQKLLDYAQRRVPGGDFRLLDLEQLDLPSGEFDAVWCIDLLDKLTPDSPARVFAQFARVLKHGGLLTFNSTASDERIRDLIELSPKFDILAREPYPEELFERGLRHITARKR
jgi:SAM-dependent methyltransferase